MGSLSRGTKQELFSILPAGTVLPFAGGTAPEGWAICDGSTVSRSEYSELYLAIGDSWGNGDGSTTFHLPDMRGRFLRGSTQGMDPLDAAERDPDYASRTVSNAGGNTGDNVGSVQNDANKNHYHDAGMWFENNNNHVVYGKITTSGGNMSTNAGQYSGNLGMRVRTSDDLSAPSTENRPKNVNINYIIKL